VLGTIQDLSLFINIYKLTILLFLEFYFSNYKISKNFLMILANNKIYNV
jgi:hypothetical protein